MPMLTARTRLGTLGLLSAFAVVACNSEAATQETGFDTERSGASTATPSTSAAETGSGSGSQSEGSSTGATTADGEGSGSDGIRFDVMDGDDDPATGAQLSCKVEDALDGVGRCGQKAPPDSFDAQVQWAWNGEGGSDGVWTTPLVGNFTDDNDDGEIDLCDTPDVIVISAATDLAPGNIFVLSGDTGEVKVKFPRTVIYAITPAFGDIDGDGLPEVVAARFDPNNGGLGFRGRIAAFEHDGGLKWESTGPLVDTHGALALADLDADGDVEIIGPEQVLDHNGDLVFEIMAPQFHEGVNAPTAADLDNDGDLEVILGAAAFEHDGTIKWDTGLGGGMPQVADFDGDSLPEVLLLSTSGVSLIEHDGTIVYQERTPRTQPGTGSWGRGAAVHDMDGDGEPEWAASSGRDYRVYEWDAQMIWETEVEDLTGQAAGTAFDFLGDGFADAMYADETKLWAFGRDGRVLFETPRSSVTLIEYPVVADVDNDDSAEIVVVSSRFQGPQSPAVQVIRDAQDRWIQGRRVWNQHTYHVTNVREDGVIPQVEPQHWNLLNTFRTQAQIEGGSVCAPPVG